MERWTPYPKHGFFSCHCRSKALLGLALAANPKLCVWSEERMMKEPDFDKREWWLLFSAFLGWFFQFPPGSTELLPGLIRSHWADTGDLLATYTCCYSKLLKDFRAGMEQDEGFSLHVSFTSFFVVMEIPVPVAAVKTTFYLGWFLNCKSSQ